MAGIVTGSGQDAALVTGSRGRPRLLHWHERTYRVTDAPTPLEEALAPALTHPLPVHGWRFQGTSVHDGETLVFDVVACGGGWHVLKTYA
jgi:23S rRNA G2445 N2-methylase RlmL